VLEKLKLFSLRVWATTNKHDCHRTITAAAAEGIAIAIMGVAGISLHRSI
jgi:hypothetical protein